MYIIKSKGTATIKASLQIRDADFRLLISCPVSALKMNLQKLEVDKKRIDELVKITDENPEGIIIKV